MVFSQYEHIFYELQECYVDVDQGNEYDMRDYDSVL